MEHSAMAAITINPQAEVPARAAAAIAGAIHVGSTTLASGRQVHHYEQQPLYTLLAQRNALVDAANALVDPPNEQLDDAAIGYETVERAIRETPAETVDDVVAKMALVGEFVREQGCPDVDDVEAVLAEARSVLIRACDPMRSETVALHDAHWTLAPVDNTSPAIAALDQEVSRRYADERTAMEGDDEAVYEAAVAHTGPIAHQLMATPATTLADFRAKARAVAWALSDDWDGDLIGGSTASDFAVSLVRELLGHPPVPVAPTSAALLAAE